MAATRDLPPGIRKTATGYQAYVWVVDHTHKAGGFQASKRYPPDTAISEMKAWRKKRSLNLPEDATKQTTSFAEDAREYLSRDKVQRMPTADQRTQHTEEWIAIFGDRERSTIEPHEIQAALDRMRSYLSAGSVNKRRTALMDLWTTLDGRHNANPAKGTREYPEPVPEPRAPALSTVLTLLAKLPTATEYSRKCRARLRVIAWTGWPHIIVKALDRADREHWKTGKAYVGRRKKGKGSRARWLPLLPEAKRALEEFHAADAYGWFSNSSLHKRVTRACKDLSIRHVRPYDFRHFFLTLIATITRDERAVMELGLISTPKIARRYTEAATDPRVQAAVAAVAKRLPGLKRAASKLAESGRVSRGPVKPSKPDRARRSPRKTSKSMELVVGASGFEPLTPAV